MAPAAFRKRVVGLVAVAIAVPLGFAVALGASHFGKPDATLQRLADDAALAGVNALAASHGQPDHSRVAASIAAASKVVSGHPAIIRAITPSGDALTVAVVLADPDDRIVSSAAAHYIAPSDGVAAQTSAGLGPTASRARM